MTVCEWKKKQMTTKVAKGVIWCLQEFFVSLQSEKRKDKHAERKEQG